MKEKKEKKTKLGKANKPTSEVVFATTHNFWDAHQYRRVTKRVDDGASLCDDLSRLVDER
jgi:hypothetical protein